MDKNVCNNENLNKEYNQFKKTRDYIKLILLGIVFLLIIIIFLFMDITAISILLAFILFGILLYVRWSPLDEWENSLNKRISEEKLKEAYKFGDTKYLISKNEKIIVINDQFVPLKYIDKTRYNELNIPMELRTE